MVFIGADNSRLQNYKITKFTVSVRSGGGSCGGGAGVLNLTFETKLNMYE